MPLDRGDCVVVSRAQIKVIASLETGFRVCCGEIRTADEVGAEEELLDSGGTGVVVS